jgi:uncharacterized protein (TIGR02265 family)
MESAFFSPDWNAPLDVEERLRGMPSWVAIKGMFFHSLLKEAARHQKHIEGDSYIAFKSYPGHDYVRLSVKVAAAIYPELSLREGLRRMGQTVYPTLLQSMIGRVVFGALGGDVRAIMRLVPKGYSISSKVGEVVVKEVSDTHALLSFKEFYGFYDCYQVGVIEGAILFCKKKPDIKIRVLAPGQFEMLCHWI